MLIIDWLLTQLDSTGFKLMVTVFLVVGTIELIIPVARIPMRHYAFNVSYALVNMLATALIAPIAAFGVAVVMRHATQGLIDLKALGFGGIAGAALAVFLSTAIFDFFYYWLHRLQHGSTILWQEHLLHHSDEHVNVTTSGRTHVLEQFLFPVFIVIPMSILFALPPVAIAVVALLPTIWAYIVHANVKLSFGSFWWLLASPQYHRIHHSLEPQHIDKNFAVWFPVWDILFGTVFRPRPGEYPRTGVAGVVVKSLTEAYLLPFRRWAAMLRRTGSRAQA